MRTTQVRLTVLAGFVAVLLAFSALSQDETPPANDGSSVEIVPRFGPVRKRASTGLPRPSDVSVAEFEKQLFQFLGDKKYRELKWARDKRLRDTGPFLDGKYYGTHPAVRVYYSPEVVQWLDGGRKGTIPDGAMIIKEQYPAPAVRHEGKSEAEVLGLA